MNNNLDNILLLYRIAKYYYLDNYSQQEIAKLENLSRSQISRLLTKAHEAGIVKIDISLPSLIDREVLENKLKNLFGLDKVVLSPSSQVREENDQALYLTAAEYLSAALIPARRIGIGCGQTLYNVSLNLSNYQDDETRVFYTLIGVSGTDKPYLQTNSIVDRFAEKFHAKVYYNNFPYLVCPERLSAMEQKRWDTMAHYWNTIDTAVVGLGGYQQSKEPYFEELKELNDTPVHLEELKIMKGDLLGHFFKDDYEYYHFPEAFKVSSPGLKDMQKCRKVICIAHGALKADAIISAARQKYIDQLITDENTGKILLEKLQQTMKDVTM